MYEIKQKLGDTNFSKKLNSMYERIKRVFNNFYQNSKENFYNALKSKDYFSIYINIAVYVFVFSIAFNIIGYIRSVWNYKPRVESLIENSMKSVGFSLIWPITIPFLTVDYGTKTIRKLVKGG